MEYMAGHPASGADLAMVRCSRPSTLMGKTTFAATTPDAGVGDNPIILPYLDFNCGGVSKQNSFGAQPSVLVIDAVVSLEYEGCSIKSMGKEDVVRHGWCLRVVAIERGPPLAGSPAYLWMIWRSIREAIVPPPRTR